MVWYVSAFKCNNFGKQFPFWLHNSFFFLRMKVLNLMIWKKIFPWCLLPLTPAAWSWQSKKFGLVLQPPPMCAPQPIYIQGIILPDLKERKWQFCFKLHLYLVGFEWNFNNFWSFSGNGNFEFVYITVRLASVFYCCHFYGSGARKFLARCD